MCAYCYCKINIRCKRWLTELFMRGRHFQLIHEANGTKYGERTSNAVNENMPGGGGDVRDSQIKVFIIIFFF